MDDRSKAFLDQYLSSLAPRVARKFTSFSADYFCADQYNADLCADLILRGEKRASCSLAYWYSHKGEKMPEAGSLQVVLNWAGEPVCVIEVISVETCLYQDVTPDLAAAEGEGDKTLAWWRQTHWDFFSKECFELGIEPRDDMPLIFEHFKVVYPFQGQP